MVFFGGGGTIFVKSKKGPKIKFHFRDPNTSYVDVIHMVKILFRD